MMRKNFREINRCNQRGGRMLSIIDLLEAGSLPENLAAYLFSAVNRARASFMVGANPGDAGKTTVMGALLNLVSPRYELRPADSLRTIQTALSRGADIEPKCWVCHEIGSGPHYAYLWGEEARAFFALSEHGHMLATNLHADTYVEAYKQLCHDNKIQENHFYRMQLQLYLVMERHPKGGIMRRINTVYESDGQSEHQCIYDLENSYTPHPLDISKLISEDDFRECGSIIRELRGKGINHIEQIEKILSSQS